MVTNEELVQRRKEAADRFESAGILITDREKAEIEIADFGLSEFTRIGLGVHVYVNTSRVCAKELAMWPHQTCPEHRHPTVDGQPGKEETFRCRAGSVYLYVSGEKTPNPACKPPAREDNGKEYTVFHEVALKPGDQYTIYPDTLHWFQAGPEGAVVSEFSTRSTDENDIFTDEQIDRITRVKA